LPLRETPASVDVITQQTMQDQGYRTNVDAAARRGRCARNQSAGAQGGFFMRGFSGDAINHLYNGINIGIQDLTGRTQDTFSFDRIEFLKGASAIESGVGSIGGSVNYVTKQPFSGPVRNETFISADSFRSVRSGFDSGGSTPIAGLDYRVVASFDNVHGFIADPKQKISTLTARWNYQNSDIPRGPGLPSSIITTKELITGVRRLRRFLIPVLFRRGVSFPERIRRSPAAVLSARSRSIRERSRPTTIR
jgi:iron complex outermembrane receptor protein